MHTIMDEYLIELTFFLLVLNPYGAVYVLRSRKRGNFLTPSPLILLIPLF